MLNYIDNILSCIKENVNIVIFCTHSVLSMGFLLHHLYDVFIGVNFNKLLNLEEIKLFYYNNNILLSKNTFPIFCSSINTLLDNEMFCKCLKDFLVLHRDNNYNFFLSQMKSNFKDDYVCIFKLIEKGESFEKIIKKGFGHEALFIIHKKIINSLID